MGRHLSPRLRRLLKLCICSVCVVVVGLRRVVAFPAPWAQAGAAVFIGMEAPKVEFWVNLLCSAAPLASLMARPL